ncbi:MAG: mannosyltransferase family protein [Candidatus Levybacteria bacterium]|nr:mannosyltransferase family protein [Candidatus Levybacteria bacterium]
MTKRIILLFLGWRLFLFIPIIASQVLLPRPGYEYALLTHFLDKSSILSNFLLYPFGNFDGAYYLLIAAEGYTVNAGFFPLFPLLINISTHIFGFNILAFDPRQYITANFMVSVFFILSLVLMHKLVRLDYKKNIAIWSIIFLLIFPTSFFYAAIYSESLFLFLSLLTFYLARKKNWMWAGIAGALLSATRIVGIAIWPALFYEYLKESKNKLTIKILPLLAVPLGLVAYMYYNFVKWGNPLYFIQAQGNFQNNRSVDSIVLLPQTLFRYAKILLSLKPSVYEWWIAFVEVSFSVLALSLFYVAWRRRIRFSYLLFGFICFIVPASTGTFSALPRYLAVIFPLFIALALLENKFFKIFFSIASIVLLFIFFLLFSKGYYVS